MMQPSSPPLVRQIVERFALPMRLGRTLGLIDSGEARRRLRSHLVKPIAAPEVVARENLDELLSGLSVLHMAGAADFDDLDEVGLPAAEVLEVLRDRAVARYYEKHYPIALPVLLRESLEDNTVYRAIARGERERPEWSSHFSAFLLLDAIFGAPGPMDKFLTLLDDYRVDGIWLEDLYAAMESRGHLTRWLKAPERRRILEGMQDFFSFSEQLDALLGRMEDMPLLRGQIWLYFGYWYGGGGERMRGVAEWIADLLEEFATGDEDEAAIALGAAERRPHFEKLRSVFKRMTGPDYPWALLEAFPDELKRWRRNAKLAFERPRGGRRPDRAL